MSKKKICFYVTVVLIIIAGVAVGLYQSCYGEKEVVSIVDKTIQKDKAVMVEKADTCDYLWFEVVVKLSTTLDKATTDTLPAVEMRNVYETVVEMTDSVTGQTGYAYTSFDFRHNFVEKIDTMFIVEEPWLEDINMKAQEDSLISFQKAYEIVMKSNVVKPHSVNVVLRNAVGPKIAHPHFIFGNAKGSIYVDAITGELKTEDPWFSKD